MPQLDWSKFAKLAGATSENWELLCRSLIRRNFSHAGQFSSLKNQPGVEFHLRLTDDCSLGKTGTWHGWQCKWFQLKKDGNLSVAQRRQIQESLRTTEEHLPNLTTWYLWTPQTLSKTDQEWFYGLASIHRRELWTKDEVSNLLGGESAILRETFFGELVYDAKRLSVMHECAIGPIKDRWIPGLHVYTEPEKQFSRKLLRPGVLAEEEKLLHQLMFYAEKMRNQITDIGQDELQVVRSLSDELVYLHETLSKTIHACNNGEFAVVNDTVQGCAWNTEKGRPAYLLCRSLKARNAKFALELTCCLITRRLAFEALEHIASLLRKNLVAFIGGRGVGKTFLSAELTKPAKTNPGGVLLLAAPLENRGSVDDLVKRLHKAGTESFSDLLEATNAFGERSRARIPVIIDGLNESEDPRIWKDILNSALPLLKTLDHVVLGVTLRGNVSEDCLPMEAYRIQLTGFETHLRTAVSKYFEYYKISADQIRLPLRQFSSPLFLRLFCEATNPSRSRRVAINSVPQTVASVFEKYHRATCKKIAQRIGWHRDDVRNALRSVAMKLWGTNGRTLKFGQIRKILDDGRLKWEGSLTQAMEYEGIIFRDQTFKKKEESGITFDGFAGFCIAEAIISKITADQLDKFFEQTKVAAKLSGDVFNDHPLSRDIVASLASLVPQKFGGKNLWTLVVPNMKDFALKEAANIDKRHIDFSTLQELRQLLKRDNTNYHRLYEVAYECDHPLNAEYLDSILLEMDMADRDLNWSEFVRQNASLLINSCHNALAQLRPKSDLDDKRARLMLLWHKWLLTTTVQELRDLATKAIVSIGQLFPGLVFKECIRSQDINDRYVTARLYNAAYGTCLANQALLPTCMVELESFFQSLAELDSPGGQSKLFNDWEVREAIRDMVDFAVHFGISIPAKFAEAYKNHGHRFPLPYQDEWDANSKSIGRNQLGMDFENYTVGSLFKDRRNYDNSHVAYEDSLHRIRRIAWQLGLYRPEFEEIDKKIRSQRYSEFEEERPTSERYAKKYAWISYYDEVGRLDSNSKLQLGDRQALGIPAPEIDPSFPSKPPPLPLKIESWLEDGRKDGDEKWIKTQKVTLPEELFCSSSLIGQKGPWLLARGWLNCECDKLKREVFGYVVTCLTPKRFKEKLIKTIESELYLGNGYLPEEPSDYRVYAAELPWINRFENEDEWEYDDRYMGKVITKTQKDIPVEIITHSYHFECKTKKTSVASGFSLPSRNFARHFGLTALFGYLHQVDKERLVASLTFSKPKGFSEGNLCYIREDLIREYAEFKKLSLVQVAWGERNLLSSSYHENERPDWLQSVYSNYSNVWKYVRSV